MKIKLHPRFEKSYRNRILPNKKLVEQTRKRIALFSENPMHPLLQNHALTGVKQGLRSFSVTGDIRVVYQPSGDDEAIFFDIGSHNQVY